MDGRSKLKNGRKKTHDTGDPYHIERSKVKGQGNKVTGENGSSFKARLQLVSPPDELVYVGVKCQKRH